MLSHREKFIIFPKLILKASNWKPLNIPTREPSRYHSCHYPNMKILVWTTQSLVKCRRKIKASDKIVPLSPKKYLSVLQMTFSYFSYGTWTFFFEKRQIENFWRKIRMKNFLKYLSIQLFLIFHFTDFETKFFRPFQDHRPLKFQSSAFVHQKSAQRLTAF